MTQVRCLKVKTNKNFIKFGVFRNDISKGKCQRELFLREHSQMMSFKLDPKLKPVRKWGYGRLHHVFNVIKVVSNVQRLLITTVNCYGNNGI